MAVYTGLENTISGIRTDISNLQSSLSTVNSNLSNKVSKQTTSGLFVYAHNGSTETEVQVGTTVAQIDGTAIPTTNAVVDYVAANAGGGGGLTTVNPSVYKSIPASYFSESAFTGSSYLYGIGARYKGMCSTATTITSTLDPEKPVLFQTSIYSESGTYLLPFISIPEGTIQSMYDFVTPAPMFPVAVMTATTIKTPIYLSMEFARVSSGTTLQFYTIFAYYAVTKTSSHTLETYTRILQ